MTVPKLAVVDILPDGARVYQFVNGFSAGWFFSEAKANPIRFDTPEAARLAWEINPDPIRVAKWGSVDAPLYHGGTI